MSFKKSILLLIVSLLAGSTLAQQNEPPKKEFRATWMATVINLDWPASGNLPVRFQKESLTDRLDDLKAAGINTLYFQIRTEGDALYDSDIEPWSKYLTGEEGVAPDPYWDPLEFVIEEAHKRGMELHAWLNPYRAMRTIPDDFSQKIFNNESIDESLKPILGRYYDANSKNKLPRTTARDSLHVANKHPEWLFVMNDKIAIMNPGLPEVMEYNVKVVMDVVNRYDVDGIHFDDYFYPYPPNHMGSSNDNEALDDSTFAQYPRGFDDKDDWRRNNIDLFVEMLHDSIQVVKPWVKFGISPFGIWKSGIPQGTSGMDAYSVIYGDGIAWLEQRTIDYITPQLYWAFTRFGTAQDYGKLADWWAEQAVANDRHIYPGHGLYRSSSSTFSNTLFDADEIPRQIRHNRNNENISGSVFFRSSNITTYSSKGFADSLKTNFYKYAALQPTMAWKDTTAPNSPQNLVVNRDSEKEYVFELSWDKPEVDMQTKASAAGHVDTLIKYAVYRVDAGSSPNTVEEMESPYNLVAVTGETSYTDIAPPSEESHWYFVTAVSRNNVESEPTAAAEGGIVVSNEEVEETPEQISLSQNYPNPFNPVTRITFDLPNSGFTTLKVFDMLGRQVTELVSRNMTAGEHTVNFDASELSSGIYIYQLNMGDVSLTRRMTLIK
ncbi:family 10 glycosylhydrolase [Gracilimonas sp.]|uniref:family 10 glycosylhydrolase n=1 Tax=Gracilimonas sp. TaxID=1974203 RepID=UPI003D0A3440